MKTKLKSVVFTLMIVTIFPVLCRCYLPSVHEKVNYDFQDFQTAFRATIPNAQKINLYVHELSDVRGDIESNVIGKANVGYFNKPKPVTVQGGIVQLSKKTLQDAFSNAGFTLVTNEKEADLVFKGRINAFWVKEIRKREEHSEAEVEFDVVFIDKARGENIWFDVKRSHVKSEPTSVGMPDTTRQNIEVINEAFKDVVNSILNDNNLLKAISDFIELRG